jgi:DNA polymerase-1
MTKNNKLILVDGSSYIYRAFFALPQLSTSDGIPTNAVYGFTTMLQRLIHDYKPALLAMVLDAPGPTFRHEVYHSYKANRPKMPESLAAQIPLIKEVIAAFNIPVIEKAGYEADDIIGTLARQAEADGADVTIITGDKDLYQLVTQHITLFDTMKDVLVDEEAVKKKIGVTPDKAIEVFGLMGDSVDNVPGVPGVGDKTAIELIQQFGSIENLYRNLDNVTKKKVRETLLTHKEQAFLSRQLVTIDTCVPLERRWTELHSGAPDTEALRGLYKRLEFTRLLKNLPREQAAGKTYHLLTTMEEVRQLFLRLKEQGSFALDLETTSEDPIRAEMVGISFAFQEHEAFYIPVAHKNVERQVEREELLQELKPLLEDASLKKIGQNIKYEYIIFKRCGITLRNIYCDTMIASYLLNPSKHNHNLDDIAMDYLDYRTTTFKEVTGSGKNAVTFDLVPLEAAKDYACEDSDITFIVSKMLLPKLREDGFDELYARVELPLLEVLADMEMAGVRIDAALLKQLSGEYAVTLASTTDKIYQLAEEEFNINSPQQMGKILFEKLKLPGAKKTKTGYSTDISVLTGLAKVHPLPAEIVSFRTLSKLKSTYIDSMPELVNPATGRIHTSYNQTVTATGRLSSSAPNLQNIPIRTDEGKRIRAAFITEPGWKMLSADYSQIELRILAHLSRDTTLIDAFVHDQDIHTRTAAEIWGVKPEDVTAQMRREAKVINFGIVYGMSAFGLSQQLDIEPRLAQAYIDDYFRKYKGVQDYIDQVITSAQERGYVATLFSRRRYVPEIKSGNVTARKFAERTAINAPIQGTAADLIKVAMIRINDRMRREQFTGRMILQVHDELIFEAPEQEIETLCALVKTEMEGVLEMSVPLKVDISWGNNWSEVH